MTTETDLLPMPEGHAAWYYIGSTHVYSTDEMESYARANVEHAIAQLQAEIEGLREQLRLSTVDQVNAEAEANDARAEIEALRREVEELRSFAEAQVELRDEAEIHAEGLAESLAELITWIPSADTYRRLGFDPEAPMWALKKAKRTLGTMGGLRND